MNIATAYPITTAAGIAVNTSKKCNPDNYDWFSSRDVRYIVVHYTGNQRDTAYGNANYFQGANRQASAHYFVDDGNIFQSVALNNRAWHCGAHTYNHPYCRNSNSVGIEMCTSGGYKVSAKTISNTVSLVAALCNLLGIKAYKVGDYVVRHYDVTGKRCPAQMAGKNNTEWTAFIAAVKAALGGSGKTPEHVKADRKDVCSVNLPILRRGSKSGYVMTMQILLNEYNDAGLTTDGDFGPATDKAVREYQKSRNLTVDGIVGAATWAQLLK